LNAADNKENYMTYPQSNKSPEPKKTDAHAGVTVSQPEDREQYINTIREKLNKIESRVVSLKDENSRLAGDLKRKADENLTRLEGKHKELKNRLENFNYSTEEKWNIDKEVFEKSFRELPMRFKGIFN
jgi:hypothetical protein